MNIKATINQESCVGCGVCVLMVPEVFSLNDTSGKAQVHGTVTMANASDVEEAVASCPAQVIQLEG